MAKFGRSCVLTPFFVFKKRGWWVGKYSKPNLLCEMLSRQPRHLYPFYSEETEAQRYSVTCPQAYISEVVGRAAPARSWLMGYVAASLARWKCYTSQLPGHPVPGWQWIEETRTHLSCSIIQSHYKSHSWLLPHWWQVNHAGFPFAQASCFESLLTNLWGAGEECLATQGRSPSVRLCRLQERKSLGPRLDRKQWGLVMSCSPEGSDPGPTWRKELLPRANRCLSAALLHLRPSFNSSVTHRCVDSNPWP